MNFSYFWEISWFHFWKQSFSDLLGRESKMLFSAGVRGKVYCFSSPPTLILIPTGPLECILLAGLDNSETIPLYFCGVFGTRGSEIHLPHVKK